MPSSSVFDTFSFLLQGTTLKYILLVPAGLILLDFLTGVTSAIRHGEFIPSELSNFMSASGDGGKFITTMIATFSAYLFSGSNVTVTAVAMSAVLVMCYSLVASVFSNIGEIFNLSPVVVKTLEQEAENLLGLPQQQQALQQQQQQTQQSQAQLYVQQPAGRTPSYVPAAPSMVAPSAPTPSYIPASFQPQVQQTQPPVRLEAPVQMAPFAPITSAQPMAPLAPQVTQVQPVVAPVQPQPVMPPLLPQQPFPSGL